MNAQEASTLAQRLNYVPCAVLLWNEPGDHFLRKEKCKVQFYSLRGGGVETSLILDISVGFDMAHLIPILWPIRSGRKIGY